MRGHDELHERKGSLQGWEQPLLHARVEVLLGFVDQLGESPVIQQPNLSDSDVIGGADGCSDLGHESSLPTGSTPEGAVTPGEPESLPPRGPVAPG